MMYKTNKELKHNARIKLNRFYGVFGMITFLLMLFDFFLSSVLAKVFPASAIFSDSPLYLACSVLCNILYTILLAGAYRAYLNCMRSLPCRINDLFFAFTNQPEHIAVYSLIQYLLSFLLTRTFDWCVSGLLGGNPSFPLLIYPLGLLIVFIIYVWFSVIFSMVLFLYCDAPWKRGSDLLKESYQLLTGNRFRYLKLRFSFVGLELLGVLAFSIGLLFVEPYIKMSLAFLYESLTADSSPNNEDAQNTASDPDSNI